MLEGALASVFLAVAGLLFSINFAVSTSLMTKASEVRQEVEKAEAARKAAADLAKKAEGG